MIHFKSKIKNKVFLIKQTKSGVFLKYFFNNRLLYYFLLLRLGKECPGLYSLHN